MTSNRRAFRCPSRIAALAALLMAVAVPPTSAQDRSPPQQADPGTALDELQRLVDQLGELIERVPRYALPEVTEDGDIIIRRKDRPGTDAPPGRPAEQRPDGVLEL